jgi:prenyltransferase beta subunit
MSERMNRRQCLQGIAGLGLAAGPTNLARAQGSGADSVAGFLETLARPDGGYRWPGNERAHLTPTYAVIGSYRLLKKEVPRRAELADWVRKNHPYALKPLNHPLPMFEYQQLRSLLWLGEDPGDLRGTLAGWRDISAYPLQYEQHRYPPFQLQAMVLMCRELLGLPRQEVAPALVDFFLQRRRANGSFNQTLATDGGDGHVMHTWWGLQALRALEIPRERTEQTVRWLQSCQLPNGGFTYRPGADIGGVDDVTYTWAAIRALEHLGGAPKDGPGAARYLMSLRNADGGYGDRPGWSSNAVATHHGLSALAALGQLEKSVETIFPNSRAVRVRSPLEENLKVFSIQIQAPGNGSPSDAVELARELRIDLWGAKNAKPGWIEQAQALAARRKVPVTFFVANEEYGTHIEVPGMGDFNHISDIMAPAGADIGPSLAGPTPLSWKEFRERRIVPLEKTKGLAYWQFGDNEEYERALLDESLERGGYAAISTFHFGNADFTNSEPVLYRYHGRLPFVALQDAHGTEPWWWCDMLAGFRTLFLAPEPTWEAWLEAVRANRVAAVRHDAVSKYRTWRHGMPDVLQFLSRREAEWKWWDEKGFRRPAAVIALLRSEDGNEAGRPTAGMRLRLRCWWDATTQGIPKRERAKLVSVEVDGQPIPTRAETVKGAQNAIVDRFHLADLPDLARGRHTARAALELVDEGRREVVAQEFEV